MRQVLRNVLFLFMLDSFGFEKEKRRKAVKKKISLKQLYVFFYYVRSKYTELHIVALSLRP